MKVATAGTSLPPRVPGANGSPVPVDIPGHARVPSPPAYAGAGVSTVLAADLVSAASLAAAGLAASAASRAAACAKAEPKVETASVSAGSAAACAAGEDKGALEVAVVPPSRWEDELADLAEARAGGSVLFATDEWFAVASNLLRSGAPVFDPHAFCEQGKVMDGWETRRKRMPGHDWCIIKLGMPGCVHGIEVDTTHFTGNQVPACSVWAASLPDDTWLGPECLRDDLGVQGTASTPQQVTAAEAACEVAEWIELVGLAKLKPGYSGEGVHRFSMPSQLAGKRVTHLRLNSYPDGGIARMRVWGVPVADFVRDIAPLGVCNLASASLGARGIACSNKHYGVPRNLLRDGRGVNMGDGWETARNPRRPLVFGGVGSKTFGGIGATPRSPFKPPSIVARSLSAPALHTMIAANDNSNDAAPPQQVQTSSSENDLHKKLAALGIEQSLGDGQYDACDWCVLRLAAVADVGEGADFSLQLDTAHFRGNFPESATVEVAYMPGASSDEVLSEHTEWRTLLPRAKLKADTNHTYAPRDSAAAGNDGAKATESDAGTAFTLINGERTRADALLERVGHASHVRVRIFPDGGIMRVRLFARATEPMPLAAARAESKGRDQQQQKGKPAPSSRASLLGRLDGASADANGAVASGDSKMPQLTVRTCVAGADKGQTITDAFLSPSRGRNSMG